MKHQKHDASFEKDGDDMYVELKNINKSFGDCQASKNVSFEIEKGEFCVIVGPSGAGKSTLLNILGGMDCVTSGSVIFNNKEIGNLTARELTKHRRNNVGFVFQSYNLVQKNIK